MIYIIDVGVDQQDGQKYMQYLNTANQVSQTYKYDKIQDNVSIKNLGSSDITVVANGSTVTINQNRSALFTNVLTFSITAVDGNPGFMAESWVINGFPDNGLANRGINVAVTASATSVAVILTQPDAVYGVEVTPSWLTTFSVTGKTSTGFTINFGTAAPASSTVDWFAVR